MKLSIITINLNNAFGLNATIQSVINQTFNDFEYIIIDGCSNDTSVQIIEKYSTDITYWVSEKDSGIYNAMNKAILKSNGDYLFFLNSGDCLYSKDTLKDIFSKNYECDFILGGIASKFKFKEYREFPPRKLTFGYIMRYGVNHQSTFTKKTVFEKHGFYDEKLNLAADWKLLIVGLCKYNLSYVTIDILIALYDTNGISSKNDLKINIEKSSVIEECFPMFSEDYKRYFKLNKYTYNGMKDIFKFLLKKYLNLNSSYFFKLKSNYF